VSTPRFPRPDYQALSLYRPDRKPVEVDLSDNTNLWGTHPAAREVVQSADTDLLARYPHLYADDLRAAAAEYFGVSPEQVTTGAGSDGILDAVWRTACEHGGTVRYPAPTFSMIEPFSLMNGRTPSPVAWSEAVADPGVLLEGDPVLVYLCRPNNPTGYQIDRAWVDDLLSRVDPESGPVVVVDEAYADFAEDSLIPLAVRHPRLLVLRTLSKAFGLAGLRVGLGFGTESLVREVEKSRGPYVISRLSEAAAVAALRSPGYVKETVQMALENRALLEVELSDRGLRTLPSSANFLFLPVAPGRAKAVSDGLREHSVSARPFTDDGEVGDGLRVSIGPWEMMERFLAALDSVRAANPEWFTPSPEGPGTNDRGGAGAPVAAPTADATESHA
jgi:histidinol-phosphate aminotransferase